ncbi:MAG: hypothetical protein Q8Q09_27035 [Deltaproteobacteria bacterium]|nr:hypothetical protein [Deltaproteobacteria bacterium]
MNARTLAALALAGAASLAAESLGAVLLRPALGAGSLTSAAMVAAALAGLATGALIALRAHKHQRFRWLSAHGPSALLGTLALATLALPRALPALATVIAPALYAVPSALRAALAALCVLPLTTLSGAAFSLLAARTDDRASERTALASAASSMGSALASLLLLAWAAPTLGALHTLDLAAVLFALSALCAHTSLVDLQLESAVDQAPTVRTPHAIAAILALVGFASITVQLAVLRVLQLAFAPTIVAFAATLAGHTLALALGEIATLAWLKRKSLTIHSTSEHASLRVAIALLVFGALLSTWLSRAFPFAVARMISVSGVSFERMLAAAFVCALVISLIPMGAVGATLSLSARSVAPGATQATPRAVLWLAVGNTLAALVAPAMLMPRVGPQGLMAASALCAMLALGLHIHRTESLGARKTTLALALAFTLGAAQLARTVDGHTLTSAPSLYTAQTSLGTLASIRHEPLATVSIRRDSSGEIALQIDGKIDATALGDAPTQTLLGLIAPTLVARPTRALVLGLGSGQTVQALRAVPGVSHVRVIERLEGVIAAAQGPFAQSNGDVLRQANVELVRDDAMLVLRASPARYDVIVSEPSNPWVSGMAALFTEQFFRLARERLTDGGAMAVWFHGGDSALTASICATFVSVFASAALVELDARGDWMLLGFARRPSLDVDAMQRRFEDPSLEALRARAETPDLATLLGRFVAGPEGLRAISASGEVLQQDALYLEFRGLRAGDGPLAAMALVQRAQDLPLAGLGAHGRALTTLLDDASASREAGMHARQRESLFARGALDQALREGELAVAAAPHNESHRHALARLYLRRALLRKRGGELGSAIDDLRSVLESHGQPQDTFRAAVLLAEWRAGTIDPLGTMRALERAISVADAMHARIPGIRLTQARLKASIGDYVVARALIEQAGRECDTDATCAAVQTLRRELNAVSPAETHAP